MFRFEPLVYNELCTWANALKYHKCKHFMPFGRTYRTLLFNALSAGHGNLGDALGPEKLEKC